MNTAAAKNEITSLLSSLEQCGSKGMRIARQFKMYRNRLERDAQREFGLSEHGIEMAFRTLLDVCLAEVMTETDAEMNDYASFWTDMCAYCKLNYTPDDEKEMCVVDDDATLDEVLASKEKQMLYKLCARIIREKYWKRCVSAWDIADIASEMYNRLVSKQVGDVFPRGIPASEAAWMAFLRKDAEFAWKNYHKKAWRHPTYSLEEPIAPDGPAADGGEVLRKVDLLGEEDSLWQPNRKDDFLASLESRHELQFVPEVFGRLSAGSKPRTRKALKRLLLDEADIETVSAELGIKPNALYVAKKRLLDAFGHKGRAMLSDVEATAA